MHWIWTAGLILLAGFVLLFFSYEKGKHSTKEISMIAVLSALSALSRVPFAAIPNVQPSTFLVMMSGWVFGPQMGFVVGTLTALTSNFFLGHGPWTPFQMLAWGLTGFGAGWLGKVLPQPRRWQLTTTIFLAGYLFGWIMNLWFWLSTVYKYTWISFVMTYSASFWFDTAHAFGNAVFAWTAGPIVLAVLHRFRRRLQVSVRGETI